MTLLINLKNKAKTVKKKKDTCACICYVENSNSLKSIIHWCFKIMFFWI